MTPKLLLVEDEEAIAESVSYALRGEGFEVDSVPDGESALARQPESYDLIILDLMLPGLSGLEVCRRLRSDSALVPILMLTAKTAEVDRVVGLEAGTDDYVVKPFSVPELVARVRAILRRRELDRAESANGTQRVGGMEIDPSRHTVSVGGQQILLTNSEFRLLRTLAERPGRVYSRRELMQRLWDSTYIGDERAADVHIANLRRKIERDPQSPVRIVTVRGAGYALAEV